MISIRQQERVVACQCLDSVDQILAQIKAELIAQLSLVEQGENDNPVTITLNIKQTVTQR